LKCGSENFETTVEESVQYGIKDFVCPGYKNNFVSGQWSSYAPAYLYIEIRSCRDFEENPDEKCASQNDIDRLVPAANADFFFKKSLFRIEYFLRKSNKDKYRLHLSAPSSGDWAKQSVQAKKLESQNLRFLVRFS